MHDELPGGREAPDHEDTGHRPFEVAGQIGDAVEETGHALASRAKNDASRVRTLFGLFRQGVVGLLLTLHLGGTAVLSGVVFSGSFPYPYMYVLMGLLLWVVFAMRFQALKNGRRSAATRSLIVNLILAAFWTVVLADQVPARPVVDGVLRLRGDSGLLWVSIAMYLTAQAGMVVHAFIVRRKVV